MRPLRVLHVTPYSPEAWAYGGIPRLSGVLVRGLAARGHDVTVCATDACTESGRLESGHAGGRWGSWPPFRTSEGVTMRIFPNVSNHLAYQQVFLPIGLRSFLEQSAGGFDVAHLHACRNVPGAIAAGHLRRAGVPYVLEPNGTAPRIERRFLAKGLFDVAVGRRVLQGASRVVAVSHAEERQLEQVGVRSGAIRLIPNPLDLDEFTPPIERGRFRPETIGSAGPMILFLGRLSPRKRLDVLVQAFAELQRQDGWLVIAGNDMGGGARARRLASSLGIADRVRFTGLLRGRQRLEALADADVVVYPSQDEIFGLVPLEALLAGTPVIVADDSGCAEVVREVGGGHIVPVGASGALAHAIDEVLSSQDAWRRAADEAAVHVRARFSRQAVCAQVEDMYRELATCH